MEYPRAVQMSELHILVWVKLKKKKLLKDTNNMMSLIKYKMPQNMEWKDNTPKT